jgi:hypothetical protein
MAYLLILSSMGGLDPPIQGPKHQRLLLWMAGSEAGHGEVFSCRKRDARDFAI